MSKRNRVVWIDRGWQPIAIGFVLSKKAWNRLAKDYNIDAEWPEAANTGGHTALMENPETGQDIILVSIYRASECDAFEVISTIVHESVHVWQFLCERIGETAPGIEMEAYGIQHITERLIEAYCKTQGKDRVWD